MILEKIKACFRILFNKPAVGDVIEIKRYYIDNLIVCKYSVVNINTDVNNNKVFKLEMLDNKHLKLPEISVCYSSQIERITPKFKAKKQKDRYVIVDYWEIE